MTGQHGASPRFHRADNLDDAIIEAAADANISVAIARQVVGTFLARWSGPRGGSKPLHQVAREIWSPPA